MDEYGNNIKLDYPVIIKHANDSYYAPSCEVFMDEHNVQWVKFTPKNGYNIGKEHIVRTSLVMIVRNEEKTNHSH